MVDTTAYQVDARATRERMILEHMGLVKRIAHAIAASVPRHVDVADLVSAGVVGLIHAVDGFDPLRGTNFEAFAKQHIRGSIKDHLRALDPLPYSTRVKLRRLDSTVAGLQQRLQRMPETSEIAAEAGCTVADVSDLLDLASRTVLFSVEELLERSDALPEKADDGLADPLARVEQQELQDLVVRWIETLPREQRLVLALYYHEHLKMREIGAVLGVTESRVSQIHSATVAALRARLRAAVGDGGAE